MKGKYILGQVKESVLEHAKTCSAGITRNLLFKKLEINKEREDERNKVHQVVSALVSLQRDGLLHKRSFKGKTFYQYVNPNKIPSLAQVA